MKPEHKQYILEHMRKQSPQQIAAALAIKERKVRRFLEQQQVYEAEDIDPLAGLAQSGPSGREEVSIATPQRLSDFLVFAVLVFLAFSLRLIYLNQIKTTPFFIPFHHGLDDYLYDTWAQAIAGGDVVGKEIFYGLPLYPYFLGFIYFLFGHSVLIAKAVQCFIGSLSCGLLYVIGRKVFNRFIGIAASLMLAFYAMDIFFEGLFVAAFLAIFLNCLVIVVLLSVYKRPHWSKWFGAGCLLGLSSLASASIYMFLPFLAFWVFRFFKSMNPMKKALSLAAVAVGIVLMIAPVTVRNYIVGKDFVPVTAHAGITFYAGNNPLSDGSFYMPAELGSNIIDNRKNSKMLAEQVLQKPLAPSEVSAFWFRQAGAFITNEPGKFFVLVLKKIALFWNAHEIPDILPLFFFRQYSPLLRLPLFNFSVVCPLAVIGALLCTRLRRPDIYLIYCLIGGIFVSAVIYFVNSRYRLQAVPLLMLFAAVTLYWCYGMVRKKQFAGLALPLAGLAVVTIFIHVRILEYRPFQAYNNLGILLQRKGLLEEAIGAYHKSIADNPDFDQAYCNLGILYLENDDYAKAIENFRRALNINPNNATAHKTIGIAYISQGDRERALAHWRWSLELNPAQEDVKAFLVRHTRE